MMSALSRYLNNGAISIDNNWPENQIRLWVLDRKNWLATGHDAAASEIDQLLPHNWLPP